MLTDLLRLMIFLFLYNLGLHAQDPQTNMRYSEEELLGQFDAANHPDFSLIPEAYTRKTSIYLRNGVLLAFESMWRAAQSEGIKLEVISATRSFSAQRSIWNRKWNAPRFMGFQAADRAREILRYSSMPGTSRHHWGTDIDLNSLENEWFETPPGSHVYSWLCANASKYGFYQVYTDKSLGRTGYEEERWHWSYLPVAEVMWEQFCEDFDDSLMQGFEGAEWADTLSIMQNYVQGIAIPDLHQRAQ